MAPAAPSSNVPQTALRPLLLAALALIPLAGSAVDEVSGEFIVLLATGFVGVVAAVVLATTAAVVVMIVVTEEELDVRAKTTAVV